MLQLPRVGWRLLACENGASPDWIIVVVVEWLIIVVRGADLSENCSSIFTCKMCVFLIRPIKTVTFLVKNGETPKLVVDFRREKHTFRKTWKSSRISPKKVTTITANLGNRRRFCV